MKLDPAKQSRSNLTLFSYVGPVITSSFQLMYEVGSSEQAHVGGTLANEKAPFFKLSTRALV